jgi:hypothetical protein
VDFLLPPCTGLKLTHLHPMHHQQLVLIVKSTNLLALHAYFLDASQRLLGLKRWADLPLKEHYLWHYLVLHQCQAGRREALLETLTDLNYLIYKALYVSIPALEADLRLACTSDLNVLLEKTSSLFEFLHRTIVRITCHSIHVKTILFTIYSPSVQNWIDMLEYSKV